MSAQFAPGCRIRVVLDKRSEREPLTVVRGVLELLEGEFFSVRGRRYGRIAVADRDRHEERAVDGDDKVYALPWKSVRFIEVIEPGSHAAEVDEHARQAEPRFRRGEAALAE